jgi:hypothetical protein
VQRREVGDVSTETSALFHVGIPEALVGAPFTHLGGFVAVLDAFALRLTQTGDPVDGFCKRHIVLGVGWCVNK